MGASRLDLRALGPRVLVPFRAVRLPARVLWCNFELAAELGFSVPPARRLDARLERELVEALSFRACAGERAARTVVLHADRYYGSGQADHRGSGRAALLLSRGVSLKGVGRTPLAGLGNARHGNGACHLLPCLAEAVFGELDAQLFSAGSTRALAILDQGRVTMVEGRARRAALVARVGAPFRVGHLVRRFGEDLSDLPELFVRLTRLAGVLVERDGRACHAETTRRLLRLHARTAAEQLRWRVLHGAISTSNLGLFGEMIDLNSQSTQARTAPISVERGRRTREGSFGGEQHGRGRELQLMLLSVTERLPPGERESARIDCERELLGLYDEALRHQLVRAAGFDERSARRLARREPARVRAYVDALLPLMRLRNPGSLNARASRCERVGVVDVFGVLGGLPRHYLEGAELRAAVRALAALELPEDPARRRRLRARLRPLLDALAERYLALLEVAPRALGLTPRAWRRVLERMRDRAALENAPLPQYYRRQLLDDVAALEPLEAAGGAPLAAAVQAFVDERVARGWRSVDALLARPVRRHADGLRKGQHVRDGVAHALHSADGRRWTIEVTIEAAPSSARLWASVAGGPWRRIPLRREGARARARIVPGASAGVLEAELRDRGRVSRRLLPYAFAIPEPPRGPRAR